MLKQSKKTDPLIDELLILVGKVAHKHIAFHDHVKILSARKGKCGHCAITIHTLLNAIDIPSRVMSVGMTHIICEFLYHGQWRIADTNLFDRPLLNRQGAYMTRQDILDHNYDNLELAIKKKDGGLSILQFITSIKSPIRYPLYYSVKRRELYYYALFVYYVFRSLLFLFVPLKNAAKRKACI